MYSELVDTLLRGDLSKTTSLLRSIRQSYSELIGSGRWTVIPDTDIVYRRPDVPAHRYIHTPKNSWFDSQNIPYNQRDLNWRMIYPTYPSCDTSWYMGIDHSRELLNLRKRKLHFTIDTSYSEGLDILPVLKWRWDSLRRCKFMQYMPYATQKKWLLEIQDIQLDHYLARIFSGEEFEDRDVWRNVAIYQPEETREILLFLFYNAPYRAPLFFDIYQFYFGKLELEEYFYSQNDSGLHRPYISALPKYFNLRSDVKIRASMIPTSRKQYLIREIMLHSDNGEDPRPLVPFLGLDFFYDPVVEGEIAQYFVKHILSQQVVCVLDTTKTDKFFEFFPDARTPQYVQWETELREARRVAGASMIKFIQKQAYPSSSSSSPSPPSSSS